MVAKCLLVIFMITMMTTLSCNSINRVSRRSNIQDLVWQEDKYLWVLENNQLIRWDVESRQSEAIKNISGELYIDAENNLWVFDKDQIHHFDGHQWKQFKPRDGFIGGHFLSIAESEQYIWVGTLGLSRYNKQSQSWEILLPPPSRSTASSITPGTMVESLVEGIHAIAPESQEEVWVGTNRGLVYLDDTQEHFWSNVDLKSEGVRCLLAMPELEDNKIWACTENGVGQWNSNQWLNFSENLSDPTLLLQGKDNEIWVLTRETGVARWNGVAWDRWTTSEGFAGERPTTAIIHSIDDQIWIGTKTGVSRWNGHSWHNYTVSDGLSSDYINKLIEGPRDTIWAGTANGINYYSPDTNQWQLFP
jgi:ligand-binding sensor domain-containing protein